MKKIIILIIALFTISFANAQWQQCKGPYGGPVTSILKVDTNIYITTGSGIYTSSNLGDSWTTINLGFTSDSTDVHSIIMKGNTLIAGGRIYGTYISTNLGNSWTLLNSNISYVKTLTVNGNNIYAGTDHGVFVSSNNGTSWLNISNGLPTATNIYTIYFIGNTIFAGTDNGVYISTNSGSSWYSANSGLPSFADVYAFLYFGNNIYIGTSSGVFLSTNSGGSWTSCGLSYSIYSLAQNGSKIYAGGTSGLYSSNNNGTSWTQSSLSPKVEVNSIYISSDTIIVCSNTGVSVSINNGNTWTSKNTNIIATDVRSLVSIGNDLYAGTYYNGISVTSNNGNSWNSLNLGLSNYQMITAMTSNGNSIIAGTEMYGPFMSTNNGNIWINDTLGMYQAVYALTTNGNTIYAGTAGNGVYKSTNNGSSWTQIGLPGTIILSVAASGNKIVAGVFGGGVYFSNNNGVTWVQTSLTVSQIYSLAINGNYIYAGTFMNGIFVTTDDGNTWTNLGLQYNPIWSILISGNNIFAGTGSYVYLSSNNGISWTNSGTGPVIFEAYSLALNNNYLFAGTSSYGVWKLSLTNDTITTSAYPSVGGTTTGDSIYSFNQPCTVSAIANSGYFFVNWKENGVIKSTSPNYTFNVSSNRHLVAYFLPSYDTITTISKPIVGGVTTGGGVYSYNQICTVVATPDTGYTFLNWKENGNIVWPLPTYTFTVNANRNLEANFIYTLGVNNYSVQSDIEIYPNPTSSTLTIETNSNTKQNLEIVNLLGQTMYTYYIYSKATVDVSAFPKGIYILKLNTDKGIVVKKFVKD